jgi:glycosyltransferase involved in cell wall biosynthesis
MRILMTGPGYGHNIHPWLEYFQRKAPEHQLSFLCKSFEFNRSDFSAINIVEYGGRRSFLPTLLGLRHERFDILYIHGAYHPIVTLFYLYLINHKRSVVNVWGYRVVERSHQGDWRDRLLYGHIFNIVDHVFCNWYGTKNLFEDYYPDHREKTVLSTWGLHNVWFLGGSVPGPSEFTRAFLASIPGDRIVCFWPKSIIEPTRFDVVVAALKEINSENRSVLQNFCLYVWLGNVEDKDYRAMLEAQVEDFGLGDHIKFVDHPYVPFSDMVHLWRRAAFGINIVSNDQLSTTVLEPMLMGKDVLLSDIEAYQHLNSRYDLRLNLVRNTPQEVAQGLTSMIAADASQKDQALLDYRSQVVRQGFHFDRNVDKLVAFLCEQV